MVEKECWCLHIDAFAPCVHGKPIKTPQNGHQLTHQSLRVNTHTALCSQSATRPERGKKTQIVHGNAKILKNMVPYPPPPNPYIPEKPFSVAFRKGITYPYQRNTIFREISRQRKNPS